MQSIRRQLGNIISAVTLNLQKKIKYICKIPYSAMDFMSKLEQFCGTHRSSRNCIDGSPSYNKREPNTLNHINSIYNNVSISLALLLNQFLLTYTFSESCK